jgi:3-phosphoshikimate 1-carboxyvinyltransferase
MKYAIYPPEEIIEDAVVTLPLSKSISTRMLILDALTPGAGNKVNAEAAVAQCDDTAVIIAALQAYATGNSTDALTVDVKASGAALRFLTAYFAVQPGCDVTITGIERLCQRPMMPLVEALQQCGASVQWLGREGCAPLRVLGTTLKGGEVTIDASQSSQFVSALLMVAPLMADGLHLKFVEAATSAPYIVMTVEMMKQRGIDVERTPLAIKVPHATYQAVDQTVEGDWSAAAFWYEMTAVSSGWFTVTNLEANSIQGDKAAAQFFECLGVETEFADDGTTALNPSPEIYGHLSLDLADNPDLAPALVATCCLIGVPFRFTGLHTLATKECNRLEALQQEMAKIGRIISPLGNGGLEWDGKSRPIVAKVEFDAHNDHRMAMALAPTAFYLPGVTLSGVESVSKSYPDYWDHLRSIGFTLTEVE